MKKKYFILFALCLIAASCSSLRLVMNTRDKDGSRIYVTSDTRLFGYDGGDVSAALGAKVAPGDSIMAIVITCDKDSDHGIFGKGDRMMFRLRDSSVITLENLYDKEYEVETGTVQTTETVRAWGYEYCYSPWTESVFVAPYEVHGFVPRTRVYKRTKSYALYLITRDQMESIINKGVIKLRIEVEDRDLEMTYPENASGIFKQMFDFLFESVTKGVVRSQF